jgi:hypothetical protein
LAFFTDAAIHADKKWVDEGWDGQTDSQFLVLGKAWMDQAPAQNRDRDRCDKKTTRNCKTTSRPAELGGIEYLS